MRQESTRANRDAHLRLNDLGSGFRGFPAPMTGKCAPVCGAANPRRKRQRSAIDRNPRETLVPHNFRTSLPVLHTTELPYALFWLDMLQPLSVVGLFQHTLQADRAHPGMVEWDIPVMWIADHWKWPGIDEGEVLCQALMKRMSGGRLWLP